MAKEIDKIIQSKTAPKSTNVLWDNGENLKINRNGKWENANNAETNNLSIDPVIWKYMCEPYCATEGTPIPDEVHNLIITDSEYGLKPIITNILLIDEYKVVSATYAADIVQTQQGTYANYMYNREAKIFTKTT